VLSTRRTVRAGHARDHGRSGHSARATPSPMLHDARALHMEAKPFAVGVRIEHPQR
jgi:hypothetical protein